MPLDSAKKDTFRILEFKLCKMCNSIFQTPTCAFGQLVKPGEHCFENKGICCTPLRGKACRGSVSMCDRDAPSAVELQDNVPCVSRPGIRHELYRTVRWSLGLKCKNHPLEPKFSWPCATLSHCQRTKAFSHPLKDKFKRQAGAPVSLLRSGASRLARSICSSLIQGV